jgi:hypothetical protein
LYYIVTSQNHQTTVDYDQPAHVGAEHAFSQSRPEMLPRISPLPVAPNSGAAAPAPAATLSPGRGADRCEERARGGNQRCCPMCEQFQVKSADDPPAVTDQAQDDRNLNTVNRWRVGPSLRFCIPHLHHQFADLSCNLSVGVGYRRLPHTVGHCPPLRPGPRSALACRELG